MKHGLLMLTLAAAFACNVMADWADPTNGWEAQYNASAGLLPDNASTNPKWNNAYYTSTTAQMVSNAELGHTVLALDNTATTSPQTNENYNLTTGYGSGSSTDKITFDIKFQLTQDVANDQFSFVVKRVVGAETRMWIFNVNKTAVRYLNSAGTWTLFTAPIGLEWNTYRVLMDAESGLMSLYMNGSSTALIENYAARVTTGAGMMQFGDGSSGVSGMVNVDYIRWTNSEFAPVPEPVTLAVLSTGGILLFVKRRKKLA